MSKNKSKEYQKKEQEVLIEEEIITEDVVEEAIEECISVEEVKEVNETTEEESVEYYIQEGDTVKIIAKGNSNNLGTGNPVDGLGLIGKVSRVRYDREFSFRIVKDGGLIGFYKVDALEKI